LAYIAVKLCNHSVNTPPVSSIEAGALYWHMVDLVWIVLFPLVYVL
jgi:nitric oxide reductase NorE protein